MSPSGLLDRLTDDPRWQAALWSLLLVMVLGWGWLRWGSARAEVDRATQRHTTVTRDVQRILDLRQRTVDLAGNVRLDADLVSRAQRALTAVGLPASACQGVQPRTDQAGSTGAGPKQQSVEMLLSGLTPGEFGSWLSAWNTPDQPWRIREIMFNHQVGQTLPGQETAGMDSNRFQISVLLSAPSVEDSP